MKASTGSATALGADDEQRLLGELYALAVCLVAKSQPGDAVYGATHEEIIAALRGVLAILPRIHAPFVVGERIVVGWP